MRRKICITKYLLTARIFGMHRLIWQGEVDENTEYVMSSEGWEDIESDVLFMEREFEDLNELKEFIRRLYPEIDFTVLSVFELPEKPVLMNWEGDAI